MDVKNIKITRLDHLGLVAGLCKEAGLSEVIDKRLPKVSAQSKVSNGTLLIAMILNGLGFVSRTLHMYPEYFADKPTERLLGKGIQAEHINDDVMGRFLDALYESGVSEIYQALALKVIKYLSLECRSLNLDTTSFHLDGEYARDIDAKCIHITRGYSRDHRPDLNQVVLNLITENQAGIPLYMQACSGNANDMETFKKTVKAHVKSLKAAYQNTYLIGDAALYTQETIQTLAEQGQLFITRVPQTLSEAKALIAQSHSVSWTALEGGYAGAWFDADYGGVKQRWLLVKSTKAAARETHSLETKLNKATQACVKSFKALCKQRFACEQDAKAALKHWQEKQPFIQVEEAQIIEEISRAKRGWPGTADEKKRAFRIQGCLATSLKQREEAKQTTGLFILSTNDLNDKLTMPFLLDEYKSQQAVERGFRFLKSPDFLTASLFLKKPERIEALLMIMTCSLMVYAALEHLIRRELVKTNLFFPDMKKKPSQRPTARWVFFCFQGIHVLAIKNQTELITNILDRHRAILDCMGSAYWKFYS